MKKFIEQEAKEKADEIAIKVRYSHNAFSRWEDSDENSALGEIEGGRGEVMMVLQALGRCGMYMLCVSIVFAQCGL